MFLQWNEKVTNFKHAVLFRKVVELGSMAGAAKALNVTPSVISKRVAELENSLGVQLLIRTTRKLEVTEAGEYFYQTFCQIGGDWEELITEVARLGERPAGLLTIAAPALVHSRVLMGSLNSFSTLYPDISFDLKGVDYEDIPVKHADISLSRDVEALNSAMFVRVPLYSYSNQLFASPAYLSKYGIPKTLGDLAQHQCLAYGQHSPSSTWVFKGGDSVSFSPYMCSDKTEILIQAAINGQGIIYVPELILQKELAQAWLVRLNIQGSESKLFEFVAYYRKQPHLPRKCRVFLDFLKRQNGNGQ